MPNWAKDEYFTNSGWDGILGSEKKSGQKQEKSEAKHCLGERALIKKQYGTLAKA